MKKNEWSIEHKDNEEFIDFPLIFDLVTMDKNQLGEVTSLGLARFKGVPICSVRVISGDFWDKPRKIQIPRKTIKYVLAHNLAKSIYTNGGLTASDDLVADWFELSSGKSIRDARNKYIKEHYKNIRTEKVRFLCFDGDNGIQLSLLCLDGDKFTPPKDGVFRYTGHFYSWVKGDKDISVGYGTFSA